MNSWKQLFSNNILWISILAWFIAQSLKVIITLITVRKLDIKRFVGSGGMPSSHSAFVVSLAVSIGETQGYNSPMFALAATFAMIVMYDAAGVRRAAGKQAAVLNDILAQLQSKRGVSDKKLKELIGHTPIEVIIGALLGILIAKLAF
ncbi:MAG: divergent PAP2 family protein [Xylanivirga thermophila]|uniref:divergent PAP2 family protein n=1 Tax=Xylanivirga thermophila TaxID=2496273 RepID=UPI00101DDD90|nr:divergent PAP2 family protein [Xylanivirga thermophila]